MITKENTKTSLKTLIENEATSNPFTFDEEKKIISGRGEVRTGTKEEYDRLTKHHDICVQLYNTSKEFNNYPYTSLVYFAIGGTAHKQTVFNSGYTKINTDKMKKILKWLTKLAKHCKDQKYATYDVVTHALSKFYDKVSTDDKVFNNLLKQFNCGGKRPSAWKRMEDFYKDFMSPAYDNILIEIN